MPSRKHRKPKPTATPRFTPGDIVRAIAGVETSGLPVYGVEITPTGSIKIFTGPRSDSDAAETKNADPQAEIKATKKQA